MLDTTQPTQLLHALMQRGCEVLGCEVAIMGGAMSWVSERHLVSALSNAGAFGVIAASSMPPERLDEEIQATQALLRPRHLPSAETVQNGDSPQSDAIPTADKLDKNPHPAPLSGEAGVYPPFGVNLILMHPQLDALIATCIANQVSHIVLAGGVPKRSTIDTIKQSGARVLAFAPTAAIGRKLIKMGVDALIIEGSEAGGHIGPVSTSVLAQEILPEVHDVPVFIAGGIGRGEAIASYLEMGAAGVQLGTRFVCAEESIAHANFKQAFIRASARDAVTSVQYHPDFPVIPVRAIANEASEAFIRFQKETVEKVFAGEMEKGAAQLEIEHFWAGALRRAVIDGDVTRGSLMAGQSVGMVQRTQSVQEIIDELMAQAAHYLKR